MDGHSRHPVAPVGCDAEGSNGVRADDAEEVVDVVVDDVGAFQAPFGCTVGLYPGDDTLLDLGESSLHADRGRTRAA